MLGGIPLFSERAMRLAMDRACEGSAFRACEFQTSPGELFFGFLPIRAWDVLDDEASQFSILGRRRG